MREDPFDVMEVRILLKHFSDRTPSRTCVTKALFLSLILEILTSTKIVTDMHEDNSRRVFGNRRYNNLFQCCSHLGGFYNKFRRTQRFCVESAK